MKRVLYVGSTGTVVCCCCWSLIWSFCR